MKSRIISTARFATIFLFSFSIATVYNQFNHKGYWNGTISRVQTVDMNLLSHTLPTKLSLSLINNDKEEIQRTLDSNYGLFGIVVTNCNLRDVECPEQKVLYVTKSEATWRKQLTLENLSQHPFDLLKDPPPARATAKFETPRSTERTQIGNPGGGNTIGRVYYVRGIPPTFWEDYVKWLKSPLSNSGSRKYYGLTILLSTCAGSTFWLILEWIYFQKRIKEEKAVNDEKKMRSEIFKLEQKLKSELQEKRRLISERKQFLNQYNLLSGKERDNSFKLAKKISDLEKKLGERDYLDQGYWKDVELNLKDQISKKDQTIASLKLKISDSQQSSNQLDYFQQELDKANQERSNLQQLTKKLCQDKNQQKQDLEETIRKLQIDLSETEKREFESQIVCKDLQISISTLNTQVNNLRAELDRIQNPKPDDFESLIVKTLKSYRNSTLKTWYVFPQIDVRQGKGNRQFVDCLIISRSLVVVIEAKNAPGTIGSKGDPRRTEWFSSSRNGSENIIGCSYGQNPYEQVNNYADSIMKGLRGAVSRHEVQVYGVVVLPDTADIRGIATDISGYSRIINLKNLVPLIEELEMEASRNTRNSKSAEQIREMLLGYSS